MGVGANSDKNKSLNDRKSRAAGRQNSHGPAIQAIRDAQSTGGKRRKVGGAFGKDGVANRRGSEGSGGGGGGASTRSRLANVPPSHKTH